ncbi:MAG: hypothetical protein KA369_15475 [Spirochaetes bacterium]|nr:hypothetical protein [Spirochaetota bacterium]
MKPSMSLSALCAALLMLAALSLPLPAAAQQKQGAQKKQAAQQKQAPKQQKMYEVKKKTDADGKRQWHISVGFRAGCFWWQPVWQKYVSFKEVTKGVDSFTYRMGPNAIYGPMLGFTINERWSLAWNFQYGRYIADARSLIYLSPFLIPGKIHFAVQKMDSDLLVMVTLAKFARLFFGPRYQGYRYDEKFLIFKSSEVVYHSVAMGFGCAFTVPIAAGFYFLPNLSLVGLVGWEEANPYKISYTLQSEAAIAGALGFNGNIDFGYYIAQAGISITVGFRAQYLHYLKKVRASYGNNADVFFGPSMAVVYTY